MKVPLLWFLRKAIYVTLGSALGAGLAYVVSKPEINSWTLSGAAGAISTAIVMDLKHAFLPTFLQPK
jgi:hypothetical protein